MTVITSAQNRLVKDLKQLAFSAKQRRRQRQTIVEGAHLCQGYLEQVGAPLMCVFAESAEANPEAAGIIAQAIALGAERVVLSEVNFRAISSLEAATRLLFVVTVPEPEEPIELTDHCLLLDDVQDPGNLGTVLRTAAAAGIKQIYASSGSASAWAPKTLRAGMGAHFNLQIFENSQLRPLIEGSQIPVLATSLDATETVYQQQLTQPVAWLFGNEGQGVSEELLALNVKKIIIPQNPKVESLNVAAAVAVCLFEQVRQREN